MELDKKALLTHVKKRANAQASLVAAATLDGLATAIERGDFNTKKGGNRGENTDAQARPENVREGGILAD